LKFKPTDHIVISLIVVLDFLFMPRLRMEIA